MTLADPKPSRVHDPEVYRLFHARELTCVHCGSRHVSAAHLLRGKDREDVLAALVPLCGGGSSGCHGAFDSGHSYIGDFGRKVTPELVKASVARYLRSEVGEDSAAYLIAKKGAWGAEHYVRQLEGAFVCTVDESGGVREGEWREDTHKGTRYES